MIQLPIQSLAALPLNHDIRHLVRQILFIASEAAERHRTPLLMSQKIVQLLYKTPSQLGREVYVALLDRLCHAFEDVAKEAITWLVYAEDEVSALSITLLLSLTCFSAQVQRACNRHIVAKRSCQHHSPRSATCQVVIH
jgi:CCR4-NOT transcription complex subunit 1